eukprot:4962121-Amphidinium_carterae.1
MNGKRADWQYSADSKGREWVRPNAKTNSQEYFKAPGLKAPKSLTHCLTSPQHLLCEPSVGVTWAAKQVGCHVQVCCLLLEAKQLHLFWAQVFHCRRKLCVLTIVTIH